MKLEITRDSGRKRKGGGGGEGGRYGVTGGKWMARGKLVAVKNTLLSPPTPLLSGRGTGEKIPLFSFDIQFPWHYVMDRLHRGGVFSGYASIKISRSNRRMSVFRKGRDDGGR